MLYHGAWLETAAGDRAPMGAERSSRVAAARNSFGEPAGGLWVAGPLQKGTWGAHVPARFGAGQPVPDLRSLGRQLQFEPGIRSREPGPRRWGLGLASGPNFATHATLHARAVADRS